MTIRDRLIADAQDVPSLILAANTEDPALAQALTGKALVASKSTYGATLALAVSWLATRYGLGWGADTCAMVSGVLVLGVSAALRTVTSSPITGLFQPRPVVPAPVPLAAGT